MMTTTDLDLQRRCAELVGWTNLNLKSGVLVGLRPGAPKSRGFSIVDHYPHDLDKATELYLIVEQAGKRNEFIKALTGFDPWATGYDGDKMLDRLLTATAAQYCRAFVKVMS